MYKSAQRIGAEKARFDLCVRVNKVVLEEGDRDNICCALIRGKRVVESAERNISYREPCEDFGELKIPVTMYQKAKGEEKGEEKTTFMEKNAKFVLRQAKKTTIFGGRRSSEVGYLQIDLKSLLESASPLEREEGKLILFLSNLCNTI